MHPAYGVVQLVEIWVIYFNGKEILSLILVDKWDIYLYVDLSVHEKSSDFSLVRKIIAGTRFPSYLNPECRGEMSVKFPEFLTLELVKVSR
jgi:hypothetical protein